MKKITSFSLFLTYFLISQSQIPYYVPKDSLVAWWPFSGNAQDESGNGNHGSNTGAALTTDRFGNSNRAYYFSGSNCNTRIDATLNVSKIKYGLTISAWVLRSGSGCIGPRILEFSPGYTSTYGYDGPGMAQWSWDNNYSYGWYGILTELPNGSVKGFYHSFNSTQNNVWTHMVFTIDGDSVKYYQDGKLIKSEVSSGKISLGKYLAIGRMNHPAWDAFNGKIDDLGVWSRALSASEVQDLFYTCKPQNHVKLTTSDTITECSSLTLTSQNKNYASYKWSNGNSTSSTTFTKSGLVTLTERDTNGCKNIDSVYVRILKDEISNAPDTIFYNPNSGDTLRINPSKWFGSNTFNFYNSAKSSISQIKQRYTNQDSIIWQGYIALKTNSSLKCPVSGKIHTKSLPYYLPKDSLVGWWPFTGNTKDISGNQYNATNNGAKLSTDRYGNINSSYLFNGSSDFMTIPYTIGTQKKSYTISFWIQGTDGDIITDRQGSSCSYNFRSRVQAGQIYFSKHLSYPWIENTISNNLDTTKWSHIVCTYNHSKNQMNIFVNNVLVKTTNSSIWHSSNNTITVGVLDGCGVAKGNNFKGKIDDIGIWNRTLDSSEIKDIYNETCRPQNHIKLTTSDTLISCTSLKLTSKNKSYSKYRWSTGDSFLSTVVAKSGLVTLRETDSKGCVNIDSVYVRIVKDEISQAPDTFLCNVKANDTLKLDLQNWFDNTNVLYFDQTKNPVSTANFFVKAGINKTWTGFAALNSYPSLKCPIKGKVNASVVYPRLVNKFTDTIKTVATLVKPSILDAKYNKYRWSTGDTTRNITLQNSGSYWYAHYWNATINGVGRYCYQLDSFHLSRINLITPSRISAKLGSKIIIKVKDSLNSNSVVVWSNGDTGWHTVYSVTKNSDTLFATQKDAYRSVTKSTVIVGRLEPIKASQEGNDSGEENGAGNGSGTGNSSNTGSGSSDGSENGSTEDTNDVISTQMNNSSNNTADAVAVSSTNIRIYPNPVGSEITLDGITHPMKYEIHTVTGQFVQTGLTSPKMNVNNLQTGIYILKLENVLVKFVKE